MTRRRTWVLKAAIVLMVGCNGGGTDDSNNGPDGPPSSLVKSWETGANPGWGAGSGRTGAEAMAPMMADMSSGPVDGSGALVAPGPPSKQLRPEPGVLTAGTFDDHLNPEAFDDYLANAEQRAQASLLLSDRALIQVRTPSGKPVGHAKVLVESEGEKLIAMATGSDGRALFVPSIDGRGTSADYQVTIQQGEAQADGVFTLGTTPWEIEIDVAPKLPEALDLAFVVDATGSMTDELEFLKTETIAMAAEVKAMFPHVDVRFGLIVYRDEGDQYVTRGYGFADLASFVEYVELQAANGGGDYPEAMHTALQEAAQELPWRPGYVARMVFLMADAPPHADKLEPTFAAIKSLRRDGVRVYPVAASGVADLAEYVMRTSAFATLGRYVFLTDDSGVGNAHAEPKVPCYDVEKLQTAMVRMIASELAGTLVAPDPTDIVRSVGHSVDGVCQRPLDQ